MKPRGMYERSTARAKVRDIWCRTCIDSGAQGFQSERDDNSSIAERRDRDIVEPD